MEMKGRCKLIKATLLPEEIKNQEIKQYQNIFYITEYRKKGEQASGNYCHLIILLSIYYTFKQMKLIKRSTKNINEIKW